MSRSGLERCLRRHGVGNLNALKPAEPKEAHKAFKSYVPGYLHMDVKYLPVMQDEPKRRYLQGHTQQEKSGQETKTYTYNAAERLTQYESSDGTQTHYRYDPFGRRISKSVTKDAATEVTYFVYSEQALMGELYKDGKLQRAYGFNPVAGQQGLWSTYPIWQAEAVNSDLATSQTGYHYLHTDHLGTPDMVIDKTGTTTWKSVSEVFGAIETVENSMQVNLRFSGQYCDKEVNGHYNHKRNYNLKMRDSCKKTLSA